jgi:hypothetical protein
MALSVVRVYNVELERIWKEATGTYYPSIFLERLENHGIAGEIRSENVPDKCQESDRFAMPLGIIIVIITASDSGSPCLLDAAPDKARLRVT